VTSTIGLYQPTESRPGLISGPCEYRTPTSLAFGPNKGPEWIVVFRVRIDRSSYNVGLRNYSYKFSVRVFFEQIEGEDRSTTITAWTSFDG